MAVRNWKDIPLFKDVTEEQWNDWHWQVENRLSTLEDIKAVINLTPEEEEEIAKVIDSYKTKQAINNNLMKILKSEEVGKLLKKIQPLLAGKK